MHAIFGLLTTTKPPATLQSDKKVNQDKRRITYNERGKGATKKQTVDAKHPNIILPLNDPLRQGNTHRYVLAAVGMTVFFEVLANSLVGEPENSTVGGKKSELEMEVAHDLYALVISTKRF
jgi:hypothetical protein